jgi:hypothetical protein
MEGKNMRKVWLVYDNTVGLPDELRIFTGEKAARAYKLKMQKAGVKASDIVICDEPVERTGNVEVVRSIIEDEPPKKKKAEIVITHKVPGPGPKPRPVPQPDPIPIPPPEDPDDEEERIHREEERVNKMANDLPLAIKNRRMIDVLGHENHDLMDWDSLDTSIHMNKNTFRESHVMADLRMTNSL